MFVGYSRYIRSVSLLPLLLLDSFLTCLHEWANTMRAEGAGQPDVPATPFLGSTIDHPALDAVEDCTLEATNQPNSQLLRLNNKQCLSRVVTQYFLSPWHGDLSISPET